MPNTTRVSNFLWVYWAIRTDNQEGGNMIETKVDRTITSNNDEEKIVMCKKVMCKKVMAKRVNKPTTESNMVNEKSLDKKGQDKSSFRYEKEHRDGCALDGGIVQHNQAIQMNNTMMARIVDKPCVKAQNRVVFEEGWISLDGIKVFNCDLHIVDKEIDSKSGKIFYLVKITTGRGERIIKVKPRELKTASFLEDEIDVLKHPNASKDTVVLLMYNLVLRDDNALIAKRLVGRQGWFWCKETGWVYVTKEGILSGDDHVRFSTNRGFLKNVCVSPLNKEMLRSYIDMKDITSTGVAKVLQLYYIQSLMYSMLKEYGMVPCFSCFVVGKRGSYKTSVATVLLQPSSVSKPQLSFLSTKAGIEAKFADYADAVMLIDDLTPTRDKARKAFVESIHESLTRMAGDSVSTVRNLDFSKNCNAQNYHLNGGIVFTGEVWSDTASESSLARNLILELKQKDVSLEKLGYFQSNRMVQDYFTCCFIRFLSVNPQLLPNERNSYEAIRQKYSGSFSNPRYAEYLANLLVVLNVYLDFLHRFVEVINDSEKKCLYEEYSSAAIEAIRINSSQLREKNPVVDIITAIKECALSLDPRVECNENYYCIQTQDLVSVYKEFCSKYGESSYDFSAKMITKLLYEQNLLRVQAGAAEKRYTVRNKTFGNKRHLEISVQSVENFIGE